MKIVSKSQYFKLANQGLLDNALRIWQSEEEALASSCSRFVIRSRTGGSYRRYDVARENLNQTVEAMVAEGADVKSLVFAEWMLMDHLIITGDVMMNRSDGIQLAYTFDRSPSIRDTLASLEAKNAEDAQAEKVLGRYLDQESYSRLMNLLDTWRDHVIEFALFDYPSGLFNRPLIIFEIRSY